MTYLALAVPFVGAALVLLVVAARRRRPSRRWWAATGLTLLALGVLTAIFDNVMIAADLFRYSAEEIAGPHVGQAPVEDFAWPLAVATGLPALALLLDSEEDR